MAFLAFLDFAFFRRAGFSVDAAGCFGCVVKAAASAPPLYSLVIPAKAGICCRTLPAQREKIPAYAGMTEVVARITAVRVRMADTGSKRPTRGRNDGRGSGMTQVEAAVMV